VPLATHCHARKRVRLIASTPPLSRRVVRSPLGEPTRSVGILLLCLLFHVVAPASPASGVEVQPVKHELRLIYVLEGRKPEFIFVIGQSGFKSVTSLKEHLKTWPPGSELTWAPGCERVGGEPLLSSEQEMRSFRDFLVGRGIRFVLVPSG
jgi:hypothetical protein